MKHAIGVTIAILLTLNTVTARQRTVEEVSVERYPNLQAAITDIGAAARALTVSNAQSVSSSLVIPANVSLRITGGGQIAIPAGKTLTINGAFEAPLRQVFAGDGAVRWGGNIATVYPQWWGAKMDGVADDHKMIQAAIDSFKSHAGSNIIHAGIVEITGGTRIDSTLLIEFNAVTLRGQGWGSSSDSPPRGFLKWGGAAGKPMILLRDTQGAGVEKIRLIGNSKAKPSAAIELQQAAGSTMDLTAIRDVWIGHIYKGDTDDAVQFATGILMSGTVNSDTNHFERINILGCDTGIDIQNPNDSVSHFDTLGIGFCKTGFKNNSHVVGTNWVMAGNRLDIQIQNGRRLTITDLTTEGSSQFAVVEIAGELYVESGVFQVTGAILPSGFVIDGDQGSLITLRNSRFVTDPTYTGAPVYKIRHKSPGGGAGRETLRLENMRGMSQTNLDVQGPNSYQLQKEIFFHRPPNGPYDWGVNDHVYLTGPDVYEEGRSDFASKVNVFGGPLRVRRLGAPVGVVATPTGTGATTFSYRVTAVSGGGETLASSAAACSNRERLDGSHFNVITWHPVLGADSYRVYGRKDGAERLLGTVYTHEIRQSQMGDGVQVTSFKDDGSPTPSTALPRENSTGQLVAEGGARIGDKGAAISRVLTALADLDFPITNAQSSSDLKIEVAGAASGDVVALGTPGEAILPNSSFTAWVSLDGVVTVRFNNYSPAPLNPPAGRFRVLITQF
jgi:hypothetical protein